MTSLESGISQDSLRLTTACQDYLTALDMLPAFTEMGRRDETRLGMISSDHWILLGPAPENPATEHAWVLGALPDCGAGWTCQFEDIGIIQVTHFFRPL